MNLNLCHESALTKGSNHNSLELEAGPRFYHELDSIFEKEIAEIEKQVHGVESP